MYVCKTLKAKNKCFYYFVLKLYMILELIESKYVKTLLGSVNSTGNGSVVIKKGGCRKC